MPATVGVTTSAQHALVGGLGGLVAAGFMPGIDFWALLSAFAGGLVFVFSSKELSIFERFCYLPLSTFIGYITADELVAHTFIETRAVAACAAGALAVTVILRALVAVKTGDIKSFFNWKK